MGVAERREREREQLRAQIIDAARDLLLERGVDGLSMRAIAERIEYSPATIYLYFRDKEELVREIVSTGFERLNAVTAAELARVGETASAAVQYGAMGRAYARFALENPLYFRVMFELPSTPHLPCSPPPDAGTQGFESTVAMVQQGIDAGEVVEVDARRAATLGWAMVHGLTTLYLAGHMGDQAPTEEAFEALLEYAIKSLYQGWGRRDSAGEGA
jgi:AcrR family transcriptional regulator